MQIAIKGFGKTAKKPVTGVYKAMEVVRDKDGKWVPPYQNGKAISDIRSEFSAKG